MSLDGIDQKSRSETGGRDEQRLDSAELIQDGKTNCTPDDGQGSADANDQERLARRDTEDLIDTWAVVVDHLSGK